MSTSHRSKDLSPAYSNIKTKAQIYLKWGAARYRKGDSFSMPDANWEDDSLAAVKRGMEQILLDHGLCRQQPLTGLGIGGFYALAQTLHFQVTQQFASSCESGGFLDEMHLEHCVTGQPLVLFNRVFRSWDEYEDQPDGPKIG